MVDGSLTLPKHIIHAKEDLDAAIRSVEDVDERSKLEKSFAALMEAFYTSVATSSSEYDSLLSKYRERSGRLEELEKKCKRLEGDLAQQRTDLEDLRRQQLQTNLWDAQGHYGPPMLVKPDEVFDRETPGLPNTSNAPGDPNPIAGLPLVSPLVIRASHSRTNSSAGLPLPMTPTSQSTSSGLTSQSSPRLHPSRSENHIGENIAMPSAGRIISPSPHHSRSSTDDTIPVSLPPSDTQHPIDLEADPPTPQVQFPPVPPQHKYHRPSPYETRSSPEVLAEPISPISADPIPSPTSVRKSSDWSGDRTPPAWTSSVPVPTFNTDEHRQSMPSTRSFSSLGRSQSFKEHHPRDSPDKANGGSMVGQWPTGNISSEPEEFRASSDDQIHSSNSSILEDVNELRDRTVSSTLFQNRRKQPVEHGGSNPFWRDFLKQASIESKVRRLEDDFVNDPEIHPNIARSEPTVGRFLQGYSLLHCSIVWKSTDLMSVVLRHGANPNGLSISPKSDDKVTPLYLACVEGFKEGVEMLLRYGADISALSCASKKKTAFIAAAEKGTAGCLKLLIEAPRGKEVAMKPDHYGVSPLMYAAHYNKVPCVEMLLTEAELNPNVTDKDGETILHYAAKHNWTSLIERLVEVYGMDPNIRNEKVGTPLKLAKAKEAEEVLKKLGGRKLERIRPDRQDSEHASGSGFFRRLGR